MQVIGLIGGMSWESSAEYYRLLNRGVQERLGGHHSAELVLANIDFEPIKRAQHDGDWAAATAPIVAAAQRLERAGAAFALLCTNTSTRCSTRWRRRRRCLSCTWPTRPANASGLPA